MVNDVGDLAGSTLGFIEGPLSWIDNPANFDKLLFWGGLGLFLIASLAFIYILLK